MNLEHQSDLNLCRFHRDELVKIQNGEKATNLFSKYEIARLKKNGFIKFDDTQAIHVVTSKALRILEALE